MDVEGVVLVTPEEAARRLSVGRTTVYGLISSGSLTTIRIGRSRRISVAAIERFVEEMSATTALPPPEG